MDDKAVKATMQRIVAWLSGETNKRINDWVNADEESFRKIVKFMDICASQGWVYLADSPLEYANDEAVEIAEELYKNATKYFGGGK